MLTGEQVQSMTGGLKEKEGMRDRGSVLERCREREGGREKERE